MAVVNLREVRAKGKKHLVESLGGGRFAVNSCTSDNTYIVTVLYWNDDTDVSDWEANCACKWGQYHPIEVMKSGCSHVQAAAEFIRTGLEMNIPMDVIMG